MSREKDVVLHFKSNEKLLQGIKHGGKMIDLLCILEKLLSVPGRMSACGRELIYQFCSLMCNYVKI